MEVINVATCAPDVVFGQARAFDLATRLNAQMIGAAVWEVPAGGQSGPYHFHYGVEEWLYVVAGAPAVRTPDGERALTPGELVAFPAGPDGAHTLRGPGRAVIFSIGDRGFGEAFVSVYPDSDKLGAAPGVLFRRADAIDPDDKQLAPAARLGAERWTGALYVLEPGQAIDGYRHVYCEESWALVISGRPTLRHADGESELTADDIYCAPAGLQGAHQLRNDSDETARVIVFATDPTRPMSAFYPDTGTVHIRTSDSETLCFNAIDAIDDYWDGEPGATERT